MLKFSQAEQGLSHTKLNDILQICSFLWWFPGIECLRRNPIEDGAISDCSGQKSEAE